MALTKVSRGLLSTSIVDNGNATAITIDSSENVGIGVSPSASLDVRRGDADGKIAEFHQSEGYGLELSSSQSVATITAGYNQAFTFETGTTATERMRIDSSGNLLVGTTDSTLYNNTSGSGTMVNSFGRLDITRDDVMAIFNRNTSDGEMINFRKDGTTVGSIGTYVNLPYIGKADVNLLFDPAGPHIIPRGTNGGARDAAINLGSSTNRFKDLYLSGFLLAGKTASDTATVGHELRTNGVVTHTSGAVPTLYLNRTTSDGDIAVFRKNNTTVGSIGTVAGRLGIGTGDAGLFFDDDNNKISPVTMVSGTPVDSSGLLSLGYSAARFKDLYLSGGVVFGTTGGSVSSKTLDDYEEGTWTPVIAGSGGGAYTYTASATPRYTRIGNLVTLSAAITNIELSGSGHAGYVQIQGAPFNKNSSTFATGTIELSNGDMSSGQTYATVSFITASSTTVMYIRQLGDNSAGADFPVTGINSANTDFNFTITYQTA